MSFNWFNRSDDKFVNMANDPNGLAEAIRKHRMIRNILSPLGLLMFIIGAYSNHPGDYETAIFGGLMGLLALSFALYSDIIVKMLKLRGALIDINNKGNTNKKS
ncbi:MAG: hypothetical protein GXO98_06650 [Nitrospirae bacterium]|nr:hypothetical protein [Nitrospirota bacterium]